MDACKEGRLAAKPSVVISNNSNSIALQRAMKEDVAWYHLSQRTHRSLQELDAAILSVLKKHSVDIVILAGYMKRLGPKTLKTYEGKVLNIHPALLPKFGGKGMYGRRVHEAVLAAGEEATGVTIHVVNEDYDSGPIINQCKVPVCEGDTVDDLSQKVLEREHEFFVETLQEISKGTIKLV